MTAAGARARRDVEEWSARAREATAKRDIAIGRAYAAGGSLREIARLAGMTHSAVARVVARLDRAAAP